MTNELRFSKICWNYNGWRKPSGLDGKSRDSKSFERKNKFGHEEWLFDFDKLIDGYHFAALQPIGKFRDKYIGNIYNIELYSVNSNGSQWHWVGRIKNIEVIDKLMEQEAIKKYRENGWIKGMAGDLEVVGASEREFLASIQKHGLFNIRFKPEDVEEFDPTPFEDGVKITHTRYTLLTDAAVLGYQQRQASAVGSTSPELIFSGKTKKDRGDGKRTANQQAVIQCQQLHTDIQNVLWGYLKKANPGCKKVELEVGRTGNSGAIDLVIRKANGDDVFYEVKTYVSARMCIREAVGQLMEYSYYPDCALASELIIVSQAPLGDGDRQYIKLLNKKFSIPVSYMQFDHENERVIELQGAK
ncbi:MAG TPA: hypothetical protein VK171_01120 [Fimbriimonas sp.]|nr:hypothetical protein [Fimbriimonas sp.]